MSIPETETKRRNRTIVLHLENAIRSLNKGNKEAAINQLQAFIYKPLSANYRPRAARKLQPKLQII
jgi:hypothetical protein